MNRLQLYHTAVILFGIFVFANSVWFILYGYSGTTASSTFPLIGAIAGIIVGALLATKATFEVRTDKKNVSR